MGNIDYSKFKKVSSDKKSTKLIHKDGHELTIAHANLSEKMKKELQTIPDHKPQKMKMMAEVRRIAQPGQGENRFGRGRDKRVDRYRESIPGSTTWLADVPHAAPVAADWRVIPAVTRACNFGARRRSSSSQNGR